MIGAALSELIDPVNELVQADIFADDGGQLAFRHDIIREAVRGSLLSPVRRAVDRFGRLDVMMCNAGFGIAGAVMVNALVVVCVASLYASG